MKSSTQFQKEKTLKIIHLPINWGGTPMDFSLALRKRGHQSRHITLSVKPNDFHFNSDINLTYEKTVKNLLRLFFTAIWALSYFKFFHFYGRGFIELRSPPSNSFLERQIQRFHLPFLKLLRKKVYFSFLGCDMRMPDINNILCPICPLYKYQWYREMKWRILAIINRYADGVFCPPDLELYNYISRPYIQLGVIDTKKYEYVGVSKNPRELTIVHAPTNKHLKGTKYVIKAIEELKDKGYEFNFKLIENMPHEEFLNEIKSADIVLDQFIVGAFGKFALEAMAFGKPVICFIREDYLPYFPDLPIVIAKKEEIAQKLGMFLKNPQYLNDISIKSRQYVENVHDALKISEMFERVYLGIDKPIITTHHYDVGSEN